MKAGAIAAAQLWDRLRHLLEDTKISNSSDDVSAKTSEFLVPKTPSNRFEHLPSVSPEVERRDLPAAPRDSDRRSRPLRRTPSTSMMPSFVFGTSNKALLDRVAPQTPTGSPTSTSPPQLFNSINRLSPILSTGSSRRPHQRTVSAAAAELPISPRPHSPTTRASASRSLSRLGRQVSQPKPPFLSDAMRRANKSSEVLNSPTSDHAGHPHSRQSSAEALGKYGLLAMTSSATQHDSVSSQYSAPSHTSSQRSSRSISGPHSSKSPGGRSRDRGYSWSTTESSADRNRSRSQSITSTTAFIALQDDISESSEGDGNLSVNLDELSNAIAPSRPPSPVVSTVVPIVPSPLFQTIIASSSLESRAGQVMGDALGRVDEVAEPSSLLTITAHSSSEAGPPTSFTSSEREPSQSIHDFQFRASEESFASDDTMDADDNYDPSSADDDNFENSPRPGRFQLGFPQTIGTSN